MTKVAGEILTHFLKFLGLLDRVNRTRRTMLKSTTKIGFNTSKLADTPPMVYSSFTLEKNPPYEKKSITFSETRSKIPEMIPIEKLANGFTIGHMRYEATTKAKLVAANIAEASNPVTTSVAPAIAAVKIPSSTSILLDIFDATGFGDSGNFPTQDYKKIPAVSKEKTRKENLHIGNKNFKPQSVPY